MTATAVPMAFKRDIEGKFIIPIAGKRSSQWMDGEVERDVQMMIKRMRLTTLSRTDNFHTLESDSLRHDLHTGGATGPKLPHNDEAGGGDGHVVADFGLVRGAGEEDAGVMCDTVGDIEDRSDLWPQRKASVAGATPCYVISPDLTRGFPAPLPRSVALDIVRKSQEDRWAIVPYPEPFSYPPPDEVVDPTVSLGVEEVSNVWPGLYNGYKLCPPSLRGRVVTRETTVESPMEFEEGAEGMDMD